MVRLKIVAAGIFVTVAAAPVWGEVQREPDRRGGEGITRDRSERDEQRLREEACDCCMKCMAATRDTRGKEEGPPAKNGCKECCSRCGTTDLPLKRKMPPEIVK